MRSDLIKEKYTGFPRENVAIHCPGQIKDIFSEPTQRNMGMQHIALLEDKFQLSRWGAEELWKEIESHKKTWQLLQEEHRKQQERVFWLCFPSESILLNTRPYETFSCFQDYKQNPGANLKSLGSSESRKQKCWLCMLSQKSLFVQPTTNARRKDGICFVSLKAKKKIPGHSQ